MRRFSRHWRPEGPNISKLPSTPPYVSCLLRYGVRYCCSAADSAPNWMRRACRRLHGGPGTVLLRSGGRRTRTDLRRSEQPGELGGGAHGDQGAHRRAGNGAIARRWCTQGTVNLICHEGLRLADTKHYGMNQGLFGGDLEGTWRIRLPFARPLSCSRPRSVPGAPHDTVLRQGDGGTDKSAHGCDHGQPESVARDRLI
jgi:hypothetical protein